MFVRYSTEMFDLGGNGWGEGGGAFDLLDFKIFGLDLLSNWMKS